MAKGQKRLIKSSVKQSIAQLLKEAEKANKTAIQAHKTGNRQLETKNRTLSTRYIQMVMDLVKKHKVRLTKEQKNKFCRKCHRIWIPGKNVKLIYDQRHHLIRIKCKCGYTRRL